MQFVEKYLALASINGSNGWLLDIGCGEGERRSHFMDKRYAGIDPLLLRSSYDFPFVLGVAEAMPFAPQIFDVIISIEALDHFAHAERAAKEMMRVLRPGGALLIFVGTCQGESMERAENGPVEISNISEEDVHTCAFVPADLKDLFTEAFEQFNIDQYGRYQVFWGWGKRLLPSS